MKTNRPIGLTSQGGAYFFQVKKRTIEAKWKLFNIETVLCLIQGDYFNWPFYRLEQIKFEEEKEKKEKTMALTFRKSVL